MAALAALQYSGDQARDPRFKNAKISENSIISVPRSSPQTRTHDCQMLHKTTMMTKPDSSLSAGLLQNKSEV